MALRGILLVDKPRGWTSFDAVNYVRKIVANAEGKKPKHVKVGHTDTLDPLATGLLVLLIGKEYTRRAMELSKAVKEYEVTMKLGEVSTSGDAEGKIEPFDPSAATVPVSGHTAVTDSAADNVPSQEQLEAALQHFTGQIMQTPPAFSALKINGQRAYDLARQGKEVQLEARPVTIYRSELTSYDFPYAAFTSKVSSGTYIRSLVTDLGEYLATGAYMSDLRRTTVGDYSLSEAITLDNLTAEQLYNALMP